MEKEKQNIAPICVIVVPCFNESEVIDESARVLVSKIAQLRNKKKIHARSRVLFVDDGSRDDTWEKVKTLEKTYKHDIAGIKFAHNKGHQNAVYAGLMQAKDFGCDCAISIDADLQDDAEAIESMIDAYNEGVDIVYGVRNNRDTDTAFKRGTAHMFYRMMSWLGTQTIPDHADFRLMSAPVISALSQYQESNLFLRGLVPDLGFNSARVFYKRAARQAGESKYPLGKMIAFALEGVTSFSVKPIRLISCLGVLSFFVSIIALIYTITSVFEGKAVAGWGSIMASVWLLGSCILFALGILGEYIGKIYTEVKHRPRYIIEEQIGLSENPIAQ